MVRYQRGDVRSFDDLYDSLKPGLLRYILSRVMDRNRAEDLLQQTFLQLHRSRHTFLPGNSVPAWATGIARHVCLMDLRSRGRRARHETPAGDELPDIPVLGEAEALGDREAIAKALSSLPDDRREALVMHHLQGLSFAEIAGILGIRVEAAKVRAHRAMQMLGKLLEKVKATTSGEGQKNRLAGGPPPKEAP